MITTGLDHQTKSAEFRRSLKYVPHFSKAESLVLNLIRKEQTLSRMDLVELTEFSRSKVSGCINSLQTKEFVIESGISNNTGGRRSVLFSLNGDKGLLFGADLGATSLDLIITDLNGMQLWRYAEPITIKDGPIKTLDRICDLFETQLDEADLTNKPILAFGVGVPGPVDFKRGMVVSPPIMPGWDRFPIIEYLHKRFPDTLIAVDNDVNIMALGEIVQGNGVGEENIIFVKIGTGIGAGITCEGRIYRGTCGCAGDIGHICVDKNGPLCPCGNLGCLEVVAGGAAIAEKALQAILDGKSTILKKYYDANNQRITAVDIGNAAKEGDEISIEIIRESGELIGSVLASLVNFYNPSMVVIGGGVSKIGNILLSSIRQSILKRSLPLSTKDLKIVFSKILDDAGVFGAVNLGLDLLLSHGMQKSKILAH
jgi:glucokinase-like ROK family protein